MKTVKLFYYAFICLFLITACGEKKEEKQLQTKTVSGVPLTHVEVDLNSDENVLPFDSLFEVVSVVRLETTDDNLVGRIWDLMFLNDKIIVEDIEDANSVMVYDMQGKYLNRIGRKGQGPGEYAFLDYVSADPATNTVTLTDIGGQKIMTYSADGKFLKSEQTPYFSQACEKLTDDIVACYANKGFRLEGETTQPHVIVSDMKKNILYTAFDEKQNKTCLSIIHPIRKFDDKLFYIPVYNKKDTIFQITTDGIIPYYCLNIERNGEITEDDKINSETLSKKLDLLSAHFGGDFVELKDYAIFQIREPKNWNRFVVYSKKEKKSYYCTGNFYNDGRLRFSIQPRFLYRDNVFVTFVSPAYILPYKEEIYKLCKKNKKEIDALFDGLTEDDNPVLFFYRIKV